jgi:hypothetical protein
MTKKPTESRCSRQPIDAYLAGELPAAAMIAVEDHLSTCQSCSSQLEAVAAPDDTWRQTRDMLSTDRFDGACSLSSTTCLTSDSRFDGDTCRAPWREHRRTWLRSNLANTSLKLLEWCRYWVCVFGLTVRRKH